MRKLELQEKPSDFSFIEIQSIYEFEQEVRQTGCIKVSINGFQTFKPKLKIEKRRFKSLFQQAITMTLKRKSRVRWIHYNSEYQNISGQTSFTSHQLS